jgi:hypothetical protein
MLIGSEFLKCKVIKKRLIKILLHSLLVMFTIPFALAWMTYNPLVQTFLARITSSYLSAELNTVIKIDGLYITPRLDLKAYGVLALDQRADTLFAAGNILLDMKRFRLQKDKKIFNVNSISISDAAFSLIRGQNDTAFSYSFIRDHFQTDAPKVVIDTISGPENWQVSLAALDLKNVRFRYIDENRVVRKVGMDYQNLDIFVNELIIEKLKILNDTFDFVVNKLSCYDRCGFKLDELSGNFRLSPLYLIADSLLAKTPQSDISLDLAFHYEGWPSYIYFTEEVEMWADIRPSEFNFIDVGYFATDLLVMDNNLRIGGKVKGTVNNLRVKDFRFTYGKSTRFSGDIRLYGLPDVRETYIHTSIEEFSLSKADVENFAIPGTYRYVPLPSELSAFGTMKIRGDFTGFYNDFVTTADFESDLGLISTDLALKQNEDHTDVVYQGTIRARRFDIGKFLNLPEYLGKMELNAHVSGSGLTGQTVEIHMAGDVDSLEFMGNTFNQVQISGEIADKKFNGHLNLQDDLGNMVFDGILDFSQKKPIFDFAANISDADLFKLNLLHRDSLLSLSVKLNCNFVGYEMDDLEGRIRIDSLEYSEGEKKWFMSQLALISLKDTGYYKNIMLSSDILDASIKGNFTYRELPYAIDSLISMEFPNWSFMPTAEFPIRRQTLDFMLNIKETTDLTNILVPDLYIQKNSEIKGHFNSITHKIEISSIAPSVSYGGINSDSLMLNLYSDSGMIRLDMSTDHFRIKERSYNDSLQLGLENFSVALQLDNDSLDFYLNWDDHDVMDHNRADIRGYYTYLDSLKSELRFLQSDVLINDTLWRIHPDNRIILGPEYLQFSSLSFLGGKQELNVNGVVSPEPDDTLSMGFKSWNLSNFDIIFRNYNFDLNGTINGYLGLNNLYDSPNFFSDMQINGLEMNNVLMGDANIQSTWNKAQKSVDVESEIIYHGNVGSSKVISVNGSYFPGRDKDNLRFELGLENFRMEALSSFVDEYISGLKGIASGTFNIAGSTSAPTLHGELKLMRTECRVNYLNTRYALGHTINFGPGEIIIRDLIIYDTLGNQAIGNGKISHQNLSNFQFDLSLKPADFIFLNTDKYQNKFFYGTAIASGDVRFYGPLDEFHIDADVVTSKETDVVIPLNNSFIETKNDFVVFQNSGNEIKEIVAKDYNVDLKGLSLELKIGITNTAEVMIFLPANMGNISSKGTGNIRLNIDPHGEFNIYGDYNFIRGTFFFTLQNLINRRFEILQGGHISFTGNPYNADVSLTALYKLKTSLSGLGASISPEYEGQRVNVNTYLRLRGKLAYPDIHFGIGFPNVKDDIKHAIYAVLDTNDVMLMSQQMISLLVMNSFSYASPSANVSASSFNIISSQLSNWLSQISNDFDIGINYIAGDEINQDELEVALSTQLFNDRLIVDGNVGVMTKDNTQQQASNIVGDVNLEYKLTPDGHIRLRAFNRSNNLNTIDDYAPYTQGVGIFYTKEFNRFREIFRRERKKEKKQKQEQESLINESNE